MNVFNLPPCFLISPLLGSGIDFGSLLDATDGIFCCCLLESDFLAYFPVRTVKVVWREFDVIEELTKIHSLTASETVNLFFISAEQVLFSGGPNSAHSSISAFCSSVLVLFWVQNCRKDRIQSREMVLCAVPAQSSPPILSGIFFPFFPLLLFLPWTLQLLRLEDSIPKPRRGTGFSFPPTLS